MLSIAASGCGRCEAGRHFCLSVQPRQPSRYGGSLKVLHLLFGTIKKRLFCISNCCGRFVCKMLLKKRPAIPPAPFLTSALTDAKCISHCCNFSLFCCRRADWKQVIVVVLPVLFLEPQMHLFDAPNKHPYFLHLSKFWLTFASLRSMKLQDFSGRLTKVMATTGCQKGNVSGEMFWHTCLSRDRDSVKYWWL